MWWILTDGTVFIFFSLFNAFRFSVHQGNKMCACFRVFFFLQLLPFPFMSTLYWRWAVFGAAELNCISECFCCCTPVYALIEWRRFMAHMHTIFRYRPLYFVVLLRFEHARLWQRSPLFPWSPVSCVHAICTWSSACRKRIYATCLAAKCRTISLLSRSALIVILALVLCWVCQMRMFGIIELSI